jgi:hypothetical protein
VSDFRRIASPPSQITGPLGEYLREVARALNDIPQLSAFSAATPNGVVMGYPGDLAVNLTSSTSDLRLYQKGGGVRSASSIGWVQV